MPRSSQRLTALLAATVLTPSVLLAACGAEPSSTVAAYDVVTSATIAPGDEVPAPIDDVVLTVAGAITRTNMGDELAFDLATLESIGLVEYAVDDPQAEGRVATFRGVLLTDVLALAGATDVTNVHAVALNDYAVDIPSEDLAYPVLLATSVDGARMPVERYGPVRVIYPSHAYDIDRTVHDPRWIWQLARVEVA